MLTRKRLQIKIKSFGMVETFVQKSILAQVESLYIEIGEFQELIRTSEIDGERDRRAPELSANSIYRWTKTRDWQVSRKTVYQFVNGQTANREYSIINPFGRLKRTFPFKMSTRSNASLYFSVCGVVQSLNPN
jgi:hypothetical protein